MVALTLPLDRELCAVCGGETAGGRSFMRVYRPEGRLEFCTPACAHAFNQRSTGHGREEGDARDAASPWNAWLESATEGNRDRW